MVDQSYEKARAKNGIDHPFEIERGILEYREYRQTAKE